MVRVTVPATSANMGSGYDSIGIALEMYNVIDLAENDHIDISDKNGQFVPKDESNLIYQCAKRVYDECGKPLSGLTNDKFELSNGKVSKHTTYFTFTKNMKTSVTTGLKLTYVNPSTGETEEIYAEKTVPIENYSNEWYQQRDVKRVLNLVSSTYRGNYTTSYAVNNDYKAYEKETWVNAKGYSSNSNYLVWINRAYQHVNVFTGSKGNWKLVKSFLDTIKPKAPQPTHYPLLLLLYVSATIHPPCRPLPQKR